MKMFFSKSFNDILESLKVDDVITLKNDVVIINGYITSINKQEESFDVFVTQSSNGDGIGQKITINEMHLSHFFESLEVKTYKRTKQDIIDIINLSLSLKNKDLFMHYTNELNKLDKKKQKIN